LGIIAVAYNHTIPAMTSEGHVKMEQKGSNSNFSRRDFLRGIPLGFAGAFVFSLTGKLLPPDRSKPPEFPEGSIFAPDKSRYGNRTQGFFDREVSR
jgi:hypothetical protein